MLSRSFLTIAPASAATRPRVRALAIALGLAAAALLAGCGHAMLNTLTPSSGYRFAEGVTYDAERRLRLDIYTPVNDKNVPVVVFFYGGRWREGEPEDYRFVGQALASRGFVAVIPDYRLYPKVKFPAFVQDAARAVRWTQQQISRYGGDPSKLFVMGHSSGAHIAAMLALNPEYLAEVGGDRAALRGMIGLAGPYDFLPLTAPDLRDMFGPPERFELSQPIVFADRDAPPLLLMHGENDETVGVANTRNLAAAIVRAGGVVETVIYPKMSHSWIVATLAAPLRGGSDVLGHIAKFVTQQSAAPPRSSVIGIEAEPVRR